MVCVCDCLCCCGCVAIAGLLFCCKFYLVVIVLVFRCLGVNCICLGCCVLFVVFVCTSIVRFVWFDPLICYFVYLCLPFGGLLTFAWLYFWIYNGILC